VRGDFLKFGLFLIAIALITLFLGAAHEAVARFIRSGETFFFVLTAIAGIGGLVYLFAGVLQQSVITTKPRVDSSPPEPRTGTDTSGRTGPGWHCTWCWAPLEEGSKYCNKCGREIR
jgi:hypothetical protein